MSEKDTKGYEGFLLSEAGFVGMDRIGGVGTACLSGDGGVSPSRGKGALALAQRLNQIGTGAPGQSEEFHQARLCYNRGRIMLSQRYARPSDVGQVHTGTEEFPLDTRGRD